MSETEQVKAVRDYYLHDNDGEPSIYHIWERGDGRGDVTTPATSSVPYRQYMIDLLRELLGKDTDAGLLSVGCGNGMIEAELTGEGFRVLGMDAMPHAIELARAKGVDAVCADVLNWTPPTGPWNVIYADGSLGHLYDPETGIAHVLARFKSWLPERGMLVLSNDPPRTDAGLQENPGVARYYWFSQDYLHRAVEDAGFTDVTSAAFTYQKPVSGPRDRIVVTGRA
jgi:predicted TPR repeat methyltransferase